MISRALASGIILFWLVMTGLLVRMEWFPGTADLLPVPIDHLFRLMFQHEQASDLVLFQADERIGDLHLQPHRFNGGAARNFLGGAGSMLLKLPGIGVQHMTLRAALALDDANNAQHFEITATLHEPRQSLPSLVIVFDGDPPHNHYHYQVRRGDEVQAEMAGTPSQLLDQPALRTYGISPALLSNLARQQDSAIEVSAHRGVLHTKGEDIETYDANLRQADAFEIVVQMSQLGQILAVKTSTGYSLLDNTLAP